MLTMKFCMESKHDAGLEMSEQTLFFSQIILYTTVLICL